MSCCSSEKAMGWSIPRSQCLCRISQQNLCNLSHWDLLLHKLNFPSSKNHGLVFFYSCLASAALVLFWDWSWKCHKAASKPGYDKCQESCCSPPNYEHVCSIDLHDLGPHRSSLNVLIFWMVLRNFYYDSFNLNYLFFYMVIDLLKLVAIFVDRSLLPFKSLCRLSSKKMSSCSGSTIIPD